MNPYQRLVVWLLICAVAASAAGCTTLKTIPPATDSTAPSFGRVKAGDTIIVHLRDGRRLSIVLQRVDADGIVSVEGVRYARTDISHLQRRSFSGWKTGLAAGGVFAAVYVLAGILVVTAWDSIW